MTSPTAILTDGSKIYAYGEIGAEITAAGAWPGASESSPALLTTGQAKAVGDWVETSGKKLTHIFVTHGHGDHWFTADMPVRRFAARVVVSAGTIKQMRFHMSIREGFWDKLWPGQIPPSPVTAVIVADNRFTLEGHDLIIAESAVPVTLEHGVEEVGCSAVLRQSVVDIVEVLAGFLMLFAPFPASICVGLILANCVAWLIPPARRTLDAEAEGYKGTGFRESTGALLRLARWAVPVGLIIVLVAASLLKSLR